MNTLARTESSPRPPPARVLVAWASTTLLLGTGLAVLRAAALWVKFRVYRHEPLDQTLARLASTLDFAAPYAVAVAAVGTGVALLAARPGAGRARAPALVLAFVLVAALFTAVLSGWPLDDADHLSDVTEPRGRAALLRLAAIALATAGLVTWGAAVIWRGGPLRTVLGGPVVLALALATAVGLPLGFHLRYGAVLSSRLVREIVRDLVFEAPCWTIEERNVAREPYVDVLTPTRSLGVDGGDMPALVLPPPSRVRFTIRPEDGPVVLRGAAGVERAAVAGQLECSVDLRVEVNGERVFHEVVRLWPDDDAQRAWRHFGDREGLALRPGDVVELATSVVVPASLPMNEQPIRAGFGGLRLERHVVRAREHATLEAPNIVLIVMDTLRADHVSCYGFPANTTPALDALARRGVLYENAYATSSWTWPSTASILTGLSPEAHGVGDDDTCYLNSQLQTLPEVLAARGYTTAAVTCNPLVAASKNFDQGFETFDASIHSFRKSDVALPAIRRWLREHAKYRFFLYLHLVDPHTPHEPRAEELARLGGTRPADFSDAAHGLYEARLSNGAGHGPRGDLRTDEVIPPAHQSWLKHSYAAAVATSDHYVGAVLEELAALGLEESTAVAFTSDHGEELLDHGLLGHGQGLNEELVRVPLIVAGAGIRARGVRSTVTVSNRHLATTLARLGGARFREVEDPLDLAVPSSASETVFFSTEHGWWNGRKERLNVYGIRSGDWVLHYAPAGRPWGADWNSDPGLGQVRLFDLAADPGQVFDLCATRLDVALDLKRQILEHVRVASARRPTRTLGAGISTLQLLRDIGYAGDEESGDPGTRLPRAPR